MFVFFIAKGGKAPLNEEIFYLLVILIQYFLVSRLQVSIIKIVSFAIFVLYLHGVRDN